jgi:AraC-like DNA-binding protein
MTVTPTELIDGPEPGTSPGDLLEDVLASVRLSGAIFLRGEYTAPWAYESPPSNELEPIFGPAARRLILFHIIADGQCWIRTMGNEYLELEAGDVVVMPYGDQHAMGSPEPATPVSIMSIMPPTPWGPFSAIQHGGGGPRTTVVCGYLYCQDPIFHPVVRALPSLFSVKPRGAAAAWVEASLAYALNAARGDHARNSRVSVRLPELVFLEVLRLYVQQAPPGTSGWLAALQDPVVGRALVELHANAAYKWTADDLAVRAACSRSTLNERFVKLVGRPPMQYLTEWRLQLAAGLLRETSLGVAAVAYRVGYEAEEAFNRAFKRLMGAPPAQWRAAQRN